MAAINLDDKFAKFSDHWAPRIIARVNGLHVKVAKCEGEFPWHTHADTDELFLVVRGTITIRLPDRDVVLKAGDMFVVPRGTEHQPVAGDECEILLIEAAGTVNTGDAVSDLEAPDGEWI